jgi:hypothetical protein
MLANAKPGAGSAGHRNIQIADFRPHEKNTLKAFFTAILPSGLVFHDLMLHEKNSSRWISFPGREYKDAAGNRQYARFVEFVDRAAADRFRDVVLEALDRYREAQP